jgi:hypothetical protein
MWTLLASGVFLTIGYLLGWYLNKDNAAPKPLEFRWECMEPGCIFRVSSEHMGTMMVMADEHNRDFHGR